MASDTQPAMMTTTRRPAHLRVLAHSRTPAADRANRGWAVAVTAGMVVVAAYFLIPVVWLIIAATKSSGDLFATPGFSFAGFHLWDNLRKLSTYDGGIFWR